MFTGIIEGIGEIKDIIPEGQNLHFRISAEMAADLKIDQSVSHNGVCLTVVEANSENYTVTAIQETLKKTNLGSLQIGDAINLERAMKLGDRLDGHLVQGHIDQVAECIGKREADGSWYFTFSYDTSLGNITIEKGSITVNGVSLTVINSELGHFSVAIIPYTYEHTNFNKIKTGSIVNIEFDIVGKYLKKLSRTCD